MAQWAVLIPSERLAEERLYHHETLSVDGVLGPAAGDDVVVVDDGTRAVALGRVSTSDPLVVTYTRRAFDTPLPVQLDLVGGYAELGGGVYENLLARLGTSDNRTWLVSLDLPIEASSPAEAVRLFWAYVRDLGPAELPAFVSPADDELAMQAFVLGEEANQDPEEDD
jgi:hypothetical protein